MTTDDGTTTMKRFTDLDDPNQIIRQQRINEKRKKKLAKRRKKTAAVMTTDNGTAKKKQFADLDPNQIIRQRDGYHYFGYKHAALDAKIKSGEIPTPMVLSESGRATGWTGKQIIDHRAKLL